MVSQRLRSISSVLGGKNSKEIFGRFGASAVPVGTEQASSLGHDTHHGSATAGGSLVWYGAG